MYCSHLVLDVIQPFQGLHKALSVQRVYPAAAYLSFQVPRLQATHCYEQGKKVCLCAYSLYTLRALGPLGRK